MIPIDSYIKLGISFYEIPVAVVDTIYSKTSGVDSRTTLASRTIQAAVDPTNSKNMERIFGGSIGDGDIGVYTDKVLYIEDTGEANRRQSFVTYQGNRYRVAQKADWVPQTGTYVYLCKRYFDQAGGF